ncbi:MULTISPECIES: SOS response-associated peptidase [unclassified Bacillus (in: firmicutes)]|uniref:SOS response-associated peptidase n=1 Tax=unclassified Bacillus (in: firmicutes) TaxID=185979 RepID=UPI0008E7EC5E|nr:MULTISPECIES: SOS response-associated peptidase [unclassified Bacillus (in: firmicutes)]SFA71777.1 Putative SOS response-associated peptidase YedK [Bacillus sp. UNCCL13]SFQ62077.1 Putative SOS response-associated peptidase YedK [Bacillus sp. cl95]
MCGRFSIAEELIRLQLQFQFEFSEELTPRYNVAPSQKVLTVVDNGGQRTGKQMKWGLVPSWATDVKIGYKMINARAEGVDIKPSFKNAFKSRRCLILADGFYEWKVTENGKQPYRFIMKNHKPFAMAGLWETWAKGDEPLTTCTIITTEPNDVTRYVHDRMPVILKEEDYDKWLDPKFSLTSELKSLLVPYTAEEMDKYAVSTLINSPKNDLAELLSPLNSL